MSLRVPLECIRSGLAGVGGFAFRVDASGSTCADFV